MFIEVRNIACPFFKHLKPRNQGFFLLIPLPVTNRISVSLAFSGQTIATSELQYMRLPWVPWSPSYCYSCPFQPEIPHFYVYLCCITIFFCLNSNCAMWGSPRHSYLPNEAPEMHSIQPSMLSLTPFLVQYYSASASNANRRQIF